MHNSFGVPIKKYEKCIIVLVCLLRYILFTKSYFTKIFCHSFGVPIKIYEKCITALVCLLRDMKNA